MKNRIFSQFLEVILVCSLLIFFFIFAFIICWFTDIITLQSVKDLTETAKTKYEVTKSLLTSKEEKVKVFDYEIESAKEVEKMSEKKFCKIVIDFTAKEAQGHYQKNGTLKWYSFIDLVLEGEYINSEWLWRICLIEKYLNRIKYKSELFNKYKKFDSEHKYRDAYICLWYCLRDDKKIRDIIKKYKK